ncbi:MAG: glycosyltransferase family 2 protein [Anaerolineales bacterium]|nr:glycosyltransferase family 2 protein [Anaerolineales bacterium]MBS3753210.1 glycosyltransferase family 2 protein [Anaerolineales bacterium]
MDCHRHLDHLRHPGFNRFDYPDPSHPIDLIVDNPFLSLIIPAYNEEKRLPSTLNQVVRFLEKQSYSHEIVIVDNASTDGTGKIIDDYAREHAGLRKLYEGQPGKGAAIRKGMLSAAGQYRFMCDADLSMPIGELNRFLPPRLEHFDLAIASREAEGSIRYHEPIYRHLGGRLINFFIQLTLLPGMQDTQCGFKCFRGPVAEDIFKHLTLHGWAFDIEILTISKMRGYRIKEVPIPWYFDSESKVNAFQDALGMLTDILTIRRNKRRGVYEK